MKLRIPDDWDGETFCHYSVCWPDSVLWAGILRGFLTLPQRGRTWDERSGSIIDAQAVGRQITELNLDLKGCLMACNDPALENALLAIAAAIEASASGGGVTINNSGCGTCDFGSPTSNVNVQTTVVLPDGSQWQVFGEQTIAELGPGEFPPAYPTLAAYDADKCAKANQMIDDWIASLDRLGNTSWTTGAIGAAIILACLVGVITVPPAVIPLLLFALTANQTLAAFIIQLENQLVEHRSEAVCILYTGDSVTAIISSIADLLDALIALIPGSGTVATILRSVALWLLSGDTLNLLFTSQARNNFPAADCSDCATTVTCFEFETEQSLLGWSVIDQTGGTVALSVVGQGMQIVTGSPTNAQNTVISSPLVAYTIQTGDQFVILYTADPVPYGRALWMTLDGVRTEIINEGTIVDHLLCASVPLTAHAGKVVSDIEIAINRAGGGTWVIRRAGFNCACP